MATTVKQIKEWPIGYKSGGFELITKTIKKKTDIDERTQSQRLTLTDGKDDILADMSVRRGFSVLPNTRIHITVCERNERDLNNRMVPALIIDQWHLDLPKTTSDEYLSGPDISQGWHEDRRIVKQKIRHWLSCNYVNRIGLGDGPTQDEKKAILLWQEFIETGE